MQPDWREPFGILDAAPVTSTPAFEIWRAPRAASGQAIRCLTCFRVSCHPADVAQRYCAGCHRWHDIPDVDVDRGAAR